MKNLTTVLIILLSIINVFGQKSIKNESFIKRTKKGIPTIEDRILSSDLRKDNIDSIHYVHFIKNNKFYILSYEITTDDYSENGEVKDIRDFTGERCIFLYCKDLSDKDNYFVFASDVVMINYRYWNCPNETRKKIENYRDVDFFHKNDSRGSHGNVVDKGDHIEITIGVDVMKNTKFIEYGTPVTFKFYLRNERKNNEPEYRVEGNEKYLNYDKSNIIY